MAEKRILPVSDETKEKIRKLSAESLPINPSAKGMKPEEVKKAFYEPIIDGSTSILKELQRIIDEANVVYGYILGTIGDVDALPGDEKELVGTINDNIKALNEVSKTLGTLSNTIGIEELEESTVLEWKKTIVSAVEFLYNLFDLTKDKDHGFLGQIQELLNGTTLSEYIANIPHLAEKTNFLHDFSKGYKREGVVPDYAVGATILEIEGHHTLSTDEMGYTHLDPHPVTAVSYNGKKIITISNAYNLPDFGISGRMYIADDGTVYDCRNYIYFDGTWAYYHQGCENRLGAYQTPAEGEVLLEQHYDCVNIFGFLNPKITGLTTGLPNSDIKGSFKFKVDPGKNISVEIYGDVNDPCLKIQYTYVDEDGHVFGYRSDHDCVKKTDYASATKAGVVKIDSGKSYGLLIDSTTGLVSIHGAAETVISAKQSTTRPITPKYLDYAVKAALSDCQITWTEDEKNAVKELLGLINTEFSTFESDEYGKISTESAMRYAQLIEICGNISQYCAYDSCDSDAVQYFAHVKNYPQKIVNDSRITIFELPSDVETRLAFFGVNENRILFDGKKVYYSQAAKVEEYGYSLKEGEGFIETVNDTASVVRLAEPIITDITDYLNSDGTLDLGLVSSSYIEVIPKYTKKQVMEMIPEDYRNAYYDEYISSMYTYSMPKIKIIIEKEV